MSDDLVAGLRAAAAHCRKRVREQLENATHPGTDAEGRDHYLRAAGTTERLAEELESMARHPLRVYPMGLPNGSTKP